MSPLALYAPFNFIVRRPCRCTFHLILSYVAPGAVRSIKVYRTSPLALYTLLRFIVRRPWRCTLY